MSCLSVDGRVDAPSSVSTCVSDLVSIPPHRLIFRPFHLTKEISGELFESVSACLSIFYTPTPTPTRIWRPLTHIRIVSPVALSPRHDSSSLRLHLTGTHNTPRRPRRHRFSYRHTCRPLLAAQPRPAPLRCTMSSASPTPTHTPVPNPHLALRSSSPDKVYTDDGGSTTGTGTGVGVGGKKKQRPKKGWKGWALLVEDEEGNVIEERKGGRSPPRPGEQPSGERPSVSPAMSLPNLPDTSRGGSFSTPCSSPTSTPTLLPLTINISLLLNVPRDEC